MRVVLAEKPSVARDIAKFLGATTQGKGFYKNDEWAVTWAFGHMVELQEPEDYKPQWKTWRLKDLPIIPDEFKLRTRKDGSVIEQLNTIKRLFQDADDLVCATDAGREGELIFRYILTWAKCEDKNWKRLWISSLTNAAITKGFAELKPSSEFDNLYHAAKCRSEADWIVGLNATRFFTVEYGQRNLLLSLGRVQTPILAMIVSRDLEIQYFEAKDFWEVYTFAKGAKFKYTAGKFKEKAKAEATIERIFGENLFIQSVSRKSEKSNPPQLYDLTSLQQDMNMRYGFTADQTLRLAQNLYESKHLTYPRTDSRYLSSEIQDSIPALLEALRTIKPVELQSINTLALTFTKRIIDDKKVTDHHAIIPTDIIAKNLVGDEAKLYDAVVTRLIAVFYPPCLKDVTVVDADSAGESFRARGKVLIEAGWRALYPIANTDEAPKKRADDEAAQELPKFKEGECHTHEPGLSQCKTSAPKRFNEASLLQLMETAGRIVDDEDLKDALKDKGVGTPATRASIIEVLIQRQYVERKGKSLVSTESGRALISLIRDERLKSPELTGDWEFRLKQIERGAYEPTQFISEVAQYTKEILQCTSGKTIDITNLGPCPICNCPVLRGKQAYGCSAWRDGCKFVFPREYYGLQIELELAREILTHKKSLTPHPLQAKGSKIFGTIHLNKKGKLSHEAAEVEKSTSDRIALGVCPVCGGDVVESKKAWGCSNWRNGCKFVIWKMMAQREIPEAIAKQVLTNGISEQLSGFRSKAGNEFDAKLKLVGQEVKFDFS
ncbi:MAG: DNA topoisomerase 3 [Lentimonas sp.]